MIKKLVSLILISASIFTLSVSVFADYGTYGPDNPGYNSTISFSAGGKGYSSLTLQPASGDLKYDCYLGSVKFVGIPTNIFPGSSTLVQFYTVTPTSHVKAGTTASFSSVHGGYSYSYKDGYGGTDQNYKLATKSTYTALGATVGVHWRA